MVPFFGPPCTVSVSYVTDCDGWTPDRTVRRTDTNGFPRHSYIVGLYSALS